jgi:hypothetical protein
MEEPTVAAAGTGGKYSATSTGRKRRTSCRVSICLLHASAYRSMNHLPSIEKRRLFILEQLEAVWYVHWNEQDGRLQRGCIGQSLDFFDLID